MPDQAFFNFTNVILYDIMSTAKAEKREYKTQDDGFRTIRFFFGSSHHPVFLFQTYKITIFNKILHKINI